MGLFDKENKGGILSKLQRATGELFASGGTESGNDPKIGKPKFCTNCGAKLNVGEKFCHNCGVQIAVNLQASASDRLEVPIAVPQPEAEPTIQENSAERKQEYAGRIQKCPNCGCIISDTVVLCPDCGMQITGRAANLTVQDFKNQLMTIENSRKGGLGGVLGVFLAADKADAQKLTLIRNFPIPNSIGDILEFMMLAIANIDVGLSKNTVMNRWNNTQQMETGATIGRTISNAWVSKMEQVYRKAEILFPNDPAFAGIQKMYFDKMKELKIKVD